jgi:hypothetical protein
MSELRSLVQGAYEMARRGYYSDALDQFRLILSHDPKHSEALYGAAASAYRLDLFSEAAQHINLLVRLQPKNLRAQELRDKIHAAELGGAPEEAEETWEEERIPVELRFGVLPNERLVGAVEGWNTLDVRVPGAEELFLQGKWENTGDLLPFRALRRAFNTARSLYWRYWGALLMGLMVWAVTLAFLTTSLISLYSFWPFLFKVFLVVMGLLLFPMSGIFGFLAYRVQFPSDQGVRPLREFFEMYPSFLFILKRLLWPTLVGIFFQITVYAFCFAGNPSPSRFSGFLWYLVPAATLLVQAYILCRCWFLNLVPIGRPEVEPVTLYGLAYRLTEGNGFAMVRFLVFEALLTVLSIATLGLLFPVLLAFQVEGFRMLAEPESEPDKDSFSD